MDKYDIPDCVILGSSPICGRGLGTRLGLFAEAIHYIRTLIKLCTGLG